LALSVTSFRFSVYCISSFFLRCLHSSISFVHLFYGSFRVQSTVFCFTFYSSNQIILLLFHCTSTFPLSPSTAQFYSSRVSCTFWRRACNYSRFHLGFLFVTYRIYSVLCRSSQIGCKNYKLLITYEFSESADFGGRTI